MLYIVFAVPVAVYMALGGFHAVISANLLQFAMGVAFVTIVFVMMTYQSFEPPARGAEHDGLPLQRRPAGQRTRARSA